MLPLEWSIYLTLDCFRCAGFSFQKCKRKRSDNVHAMTVWGSNSRAKRSTCGLLLATAEVLVVAIKFVGIWSDAVIVGTSTPKANDEGSLALYFNRFRLRRGPMAQRLTRWINRDERREIRGSNPVGCSKR